MTSLIHRRILLAGLAAATALTGAAFAQTPRSAMPPPSAEAIASLAPSGRLRAAINAGNTVLAQRAADGSVGGPTVEIARELGRRLGKPVDLIVYDAAAPVLAGQAKDHWDIAFLAGEPERAAQIAFTAPYVYIDGTYMVRNTGLYRGVADLDKPGVRIAVAQGAAYDLALTRLLKNATLVRAKTSAEAIALFQNDLSLDAVGGVRQTLVDAQKNQQSMIVLPDSYQRIEQAMATTQGRPAGSLYLAAFVEDLKASGFIRAALDRAGQGGALVAAPAAAR